MSNGMQYNSILIGVGMITKIVNYVKFLKKVNVKKFFYLNYICSSIIRVDKSKIIPYKNAIIDIEKSAKIYLANGDLEVGCDRLNGANVETNVRLRARAVWGSDGGAKIAYGTTIEILDSAVLNSKFFTMNSNSTMIAAKRIDLGDDVMIGRNVVIYDSDYHQIINEQKEIINSNEDVKIRDHVWVATNSLILKGAQIGSRSIIGANSVVKGVIPCETMYYMENRFVLREKYGDWKREKP